MESKHHKYPQQQKHPQKHLHTGLKPSSGGVIGVIGIGVGALNPVQHSGEGKCRVIGGTSIYGLIGGYAAGAGETPGIDQTVTLLHCCIYAYDGVAG